MSIHISFSYDSVAKHLPTETTITIGTIIASLAAGAAIPGFLRRAPENATPTEKVEHINNKRKIIPAIFSASLFSLGLVVSQMTISSKIYGFLNVKGILDGTWDATLACVMGGGLIVSFVSYQFVKGWNVVKVSKLQLICTCARTDIHYLFMRSHILCQSFSYYYGSRMIRHLNVHSVKTLLQATLVSRLIMSLTRSSSLGRHCLDSDGVRTCCISSVSLLLLH